MGSFNLFSNSKGIKSSLSYSVGVSGVTQGNRQALIRKFAKVGDKVRLVHDKNNRYDKYAIAVLLSNRDQIGWVKSPRNVTVAEDLSSSKVDATIEWVTDRENVGLGLLVNVE